MLAGIYYGAKYGGSTTSILLNVPGESASVVTCIDGYQMARKGRAGAALGIAAIASFIAGTVGVVGADAGRAAAREIRAVVQLAGILRADVAWASRWWCCSPAARWSRRCSRCSSACGSRASAPTSSPRTSRFTFGQIGAARRHRFRRRGDRRLRASARCSPTWSARGGADAAGAERAAQPAADAARS